MSSLLNDAVPVWPNEVRDYVEYKQETAYRLLGDVIGGTSDPEAVREMLIRKRVPSVKQTPEEVQKELGLTGKFSLFLRHLKQLLGKRNEFVGR